MEPEKKQRFHYEKGVTYFDRRSERTFFFVLTLVMLILGGLVRLGLLGGS